MAAGSSSRFGRLKQFESLAGRPVLDWSIDAARSVEGVARNVGTHAAGVVVAGEPLVDHVPLQRASKSDTTLMAQYSMKPLEKIGPLMGVTRERIRQIRERAFEKLRESPDGRALAGFWSAA